MFVTVILERLLVAVVEVFGTGDAGPGLQVPARLAGQGAVAGGRATGRWMLQLWRGGVVGRRLGYAHLTSGRSTKMVSNSCSMSPGGAALSASCNV